MLEDYGESAFVEDAANRTEEGIDMAAKPEEMEGKNLASRTPCITAVEKSGIIAKLPKQCRLISLPHSLPRMSAEGREPRAVQFLRRQQKDAVERKHHLIIRQIDPICRIHTPPFSQELPGRVRRFI